MNGLRQVSYPMYLVPAYGRKYHGSIDMLQDWVSGKDFKIQNGPYTSIRDLAKLKDDSSGVYLLQNDFVVQVG